MLHRGQGPPRHRFRRAGRGRDPREAAPHRARRRAVPRASNASARRRAASTSSRSSSPTPAPRSRSCAAHSNSRSRDRAVDPAARMLKSAPLRGFSLNDSELRYTFSCPNCAESLSIPLAKIPPVQARFGCPKCGKQMDFPSREEAARLRDAPGRRRRRAEPDPSPAAANPPARAAPAPRPIRASGLHRAERIYRVEKEGFENDVYDRRGMREPDPHRTASTRPTRSALGDDAPAPASDYPELSRSSSCARAPRSVRRPSAASTRTSSRLTRCTAPAGPLRGLRRPKGSSGAPPCGCDHCGGTVEELPVAEDR